MAVATAGLVFLHGHHRLDLHTWGLLAALWMLQSLSLWDFETHHVPLRQTLCCILLWALLVDCSALSLGSIALSLILLAIPYARPSRPLLAPIDGLVMGILVLSLPLSQAPLFLGSIGLYQLLLMAGSKAQQAPLITCIWLGYLSTLLQIF